MVIMWISTSFNCLLQKKIVVLNSVQCSRNTLLKPIKIYCYKPLTNSLLEMLSRPGMLDTVISGEVDQLKTYLWLQGMKKIWKKPFFWFLWINFKYRLFSTISAQQYSAGVYLALLNLPPHLCYTQENIICGLIPGPKQPSKHINSFLEILVYELQQLWKDVQISIGGVNIKMLAVLLCLACDSPAVRKTAGFVAVRSCYKCNKAFPTKSCTKKPNYGGFNCNQWKSPTHDEVKQTAQLYKHASTAQQRKKVTRKYGVRWSILLNPPYYDAVQFTIVDPMHNLLGSAKSFINILKENCILKSRHFSTLQASTDKFTVPTGICHIPKKI